MKTARRQELRTNELSQQLDQISVYVKQNAATLTIIVSAVAILTAGVFWYVKNRQNQVMDGWALLNDSEVLKDMSGAVDRFRGLAEENRNSALTLAVWLRIGEIAMAQIANPEGSPAGSSADPKWIDAAINAYNQILTHYPNDTSAVGQALISLGVLAENKSENEKARQSYQKIIDEPRFAGTPFAVQAKYRLDGLAQWSQPVVFAPAPVTVPVPEPLLSPPTTVSLPIPPNTPPPASSGQIPITPAPTTQPANAVPKG